MLNLNDLEKNIAKGMPSVKNPLKTTISNNITKFL